MLGPMTRTIYAYLDLACGKTMQECGLFYFLTGVKKQKHIKNVRGIRNSMKTCAPARPRMRGFPTMRGGPKHL